jgi:SAM-dependent methyltransferase
MRYFLGEIRIRPVITGLLSYIPYLFSWWDRRRPMGNTSSASYCRSIWRFHLEKYRSICSSMPNTVVEFGPGATLGVCIAALYDGVDKAFGLDASPYASDYSKNLRILNELCTMDGKTVNDFNKLSNAVKNVGSGKNETLLRYVAPWNDLKVIAESSVDLIFSHSVMEHVSESMKAYETCFYFLKPGGIMSHKIDHSSHGITKTWNGHYWIPDTLWKVITGKRLFLLNRMTALQHQNEIEAAGFNIVDRIFVEASEGDNNSSVKSTDQKDYLIKTSSFICQKPISKVTKNIL